jgi:hypothetical protein
MPPLDPDDPRVNPELHRLVNDALSKALSEERVNLDPIGGKGLHEIKQSLVQLRQKIILEYQDKKAAEGNG